MDRTEPREVARRLFTLAAMRAEHLTIVAGDAQASDLTAECAEVLGNDLAVAAQELTALGDAIVLLAERF